MKPPVKIIVTGFTASGKSTVIQVIANALIESGILCNLEAYNGFNNPFVDDETQAKRIKKIKKGLNTIVSIEERNLYHNIMEEMNGNEHRKNKQAEHIRGGSKKKASRPNSRKARKD